MCCKIKKVNCFKKNEQWYLPPDNIHVIKKTIEIALSNAKYSSNPIEYYKEMQERLLKIEELAEVEGNNCICGIKFSGNICYIPTI